MDWLRTAASDTPDAPALVTADRTVTYGELDRAADRVAGIVGTAGLGPGSTVALWGESSPGTVAAIWGIPRAGARVLLLPLGLTAATAMRLTRSADARGLWGTGDGPDLDRLLAAGSTRPTLPGAGPPHSDARFVLFTSGSTGARRGVEITGAQIAASAGAAAARLGTGPSDRWLCVLPIAHIGGLSILWRQARAGAPVELHEHFDAEAVVAALDGPVTVASLVPTMVRRILAVRSDGYSGLRAVLVGGGPVGVETIEAARRGGIPALQTYGMTETASQVCTEDPDDASVGTAGRPLDGVEVRTDPEGIIEIRGPVVTPGYLDGPASGPDGWFRTADLGRVDDAGRLVVLGRADRMIVTGGENVHPSIVEGVLLDHPDVVAARVEGQPDPEWGEAVTAAIVVSRPIDPDLVLERLRGRLAPHEVPKTLEVVDSLSRSWKEGG